MKLDKMDFVVIYIWLRMVCDSSATIMRILNEVVDYIWKCSSGECLCRQSFYKMCIFMYMYDSLHATVACISIEDTRRSLCAHVTRDSHLTHGSGPCSMHHNLHVMHLTKFPVGHDACYWTSWLTSANVAPAVATQYCNISHSWEYVCSEHWKNRIGDELTCNMFNAIVNL